MYVTTETWIDWGNQDSYTLAYGPYQDLKAAEDAMAYMVSNILRSPDYDKPDEHVQSVRSVDLSFGEEAYEIRIQEIGSGH